MAKPAIVDDIEVGEWLPVTEAEAASAASQGQPSNLRTVYNSFCELAEIVNDNLFTMHAPGRRLNSQNVLAAYTKYLSWYSAMSDELRLGQNFTPSVLFVQ